MKVHFLEVLEVVHNHQDNKLHLVYQYLKSLPHCLMFVEHCAQNHAERLMHDNVVDIDKKVEGIDILDHTIVVLDLGGDDCKREDFHKLLYV